MIDDPASDAIRIEELELQVRIGVPPEERQQPQRLTVSLTLWPEQRFTGLADEIASTVDYAAVCEEVKRLAASRTDKLIETLAEAIAQQLLDLFPLAGIEVELRKFILPGVKHVAVRIVRS